MEVNRFWQDIISFNNKMFFFLCKVYISNIFNQLTDRSANINQNIYFSSPSFVMEDAYKNLFFAINNLHLALIDPNIL